MIELTKVIPIVLRAIASAAKAPLQRNELCIKVLKQCKLDPEHPPAEFSDVYAYALVEYGVLADKAGKPEALLKLFTEPEIKTAFKKAFDQWQLQPLNEAIEQRLDWKDFGNEWNKVGNEIRTLNIDVHQEVALFRALFLSVVKRSQTPKEQWQSLMISDVQQTIKAFRAEWAQSSDPDLLADKIAERLVGELRPALTGTEALEDCRASELAEQVDGWFESLGYEREDYENRTVDYCEWIIHLPARRGYDRVLVRCVSGEAGMAQLEALKETFASQRLDEGWLISSRRISTAVEELLEDREYRGLYCYTLDGVIDQIADFDKYLAWLEGEIRKRGIDVNYIPLGCTKAEVDLTTKMPLGTSRYEEIEEYVDQWLDDSSKEHLSVLGEFGTGKTWFSLHYAWLALQKYKAAKEKGLARPRLPLVIPLRDYAKAVSVDSLFSEFFFKKHETGLQKYSAFRQMNRMGKLLIIFDGFDEMAARIDRQAMIDNFWELASVVGPGAKAILTCRTEHFPDAIEGRQLLGADLPGSKKRSRGEPPRFEVLELAKFNDGQIAQLLGQKAEESSVQKVMGNPQLLDLARRPVMVELILEALPDIQAGKPVDMARVYLYAVTRKMKNDITSKRTFTSLADKLYFLCELSWEMLRTDHMSLNYRDFPKQLQQMFAERVKEEKDLDHWRYDMMGQTMLIRNSEGDYSPAHRSLLEFFVAYKIVASLGAMAEDFTAVAREQSHLEEGQNRQNYTWDEYFKRACDAQGAPEIMPPLHQFDGKPFEELLPLLAGAKIAKAVLDLAHPMLDEKTMRGQLLPLLQATAKRSLQDVGYFGGNVTQLMLAQTTHALIDANLEAAKIKELTLIKPF